LLLPDLETASQLSDKVKQNGNLQEDGNRSLNMTAAELVEKGSWTNTANSGLLLPYKKGNKDSENVVGGPWFAGELAIVRSPTLIKDFIC